MTDVMNLNSGEILTYSLPVKDALISAFYKYQLKNGNTWTYPKVANFVYGKRTIALGDFAVRVF